MKALLQLNALTEAANFLILKPMSINNSNRNNYDTKLEICDTISVNYQALKAIIILSFLNNILF